LPTSHFLLGFELHNLGDGAELADILVFHCEAPMTSPRTTHLELHHGSDRSRRIAVNVRGSKE
jgi:hypothetical protein